MEVKTGFFRIARQPRHSVLKSLVVEVPNYDVIWSRQGAAIRTPLVSTSAALAHLDLFGEELDKEGLGLPFKLRRTLTGHWIC